MELRIEVIKVALVSTIGGKISMPKKFRKLQLRKMAGDNIGVDWPATKEFMGSCE